MGIKRTSLKIAGESGMGLLSVGSILAKTLKDLGFYINMDREYPSLIKGGHSNLQIDFDDEPVHCLSEDIDAVMALDRVGLEEYVKTVKEGGVLVHGYERRELIKDLEDNAEKRNVKLVYLPARQVAYSFGGNELMVNMVLLGMMWRVLGFDLKPLENSVREQFANKPKLLEIDLKCLRAGFDGKFEGHEVKFPCLNIAAPSQKPSTVLLDGNTAIALGAIHCGVRAYYAYPMSPSSSILTHIANFAHETKMVVKQAEDEITAVQLALGSMFMGTRSFTSTSGGGFDLMTETVSLAGMTETPLVVCVAQRPGPATGLPTWTAQGDLNLAIHAGHGEFARIVIGCSDPTSCFELIQHAMNYSEEFQTVVILLTEKVIAETQCTVQNFKLNIIPINRGLTDDKEMLKELKSDDRFEITKSGVSKRWVPCASDAFYFANGDEHSVDGKLTEDAEPVKEMYAKRMRKLNAIEKKLPEPEIYGDSHGADISFVGWGSTKCTMLDVIGECKKLGIKVNYLHYEYLYPLKVERLKEFIKENKNVCLIEGNYLGQLGELIKAKLQEHEVCFDFSKKFLKYDGRPFFLLETVKFVKANKK